MSINSLHLTASAGNPLDLTLFLSKVHEVDRDLGILINATLPKKQVASLHYEEDHSFEITYFTSREGKITHPVKEYDEMVKDALVQVETVVKGKIYPARDDQASRIEMTTGLSATRKVFGFIPAPSVYLKSVEALAHGYKLTAKIGSGFFSKEQSMVVPQNVIMFAKYPWNS